MSSTATLTLDHIWPLENDHQIEIGDYATATRVTYKWEIEAVRLDRNGRECHEEIGEFNPLDMTATGIMAEQINDNNKAGFITPGTIIEISPAFAVQLHLEETLLRSGTPVHADPDQPWELHNCMLNLKQVKSELLERIEVRINPRCSDTPLFRHRRRHELIQTA